MTHPILGQLEAQLAKLPEDALKHDMDPGFETMAQYVAGLDENRRAEVLSALVDWLKDDHPWHSRAVMDIALRLHDEQLLLAAVREATRRGVHDLARTDQYPPWLVFHLALLSTVSLWKGKPSTEVLEYLNALRNGVATTSNSRRLLGIRAWFTECLLNPAGQRQECLGAGIAELRNWGDPRLLRSGLTLLHAYFALMPEVVADLKKHLTSDEFAIGFPELAVS